MGKWWKLTKKQKRKMNIYKDAKKPISSFVYFYKDRILKMKQSSNSANLPLSIGSLARMLSAEWKSLP